MKDTAYTSLALPAHTDNTYFTEPSGLQAFHLLSHTSGEGGASLLVDGFHCAEILRKSYPLAHSILSSTPIGWHASGNEGITITPVTKFPVLNYMDGKSLRQVRWNNDDRASMLNFDAQAKSIDDWYEAARIWNSIVKDQRNEYWEQLRPGRPLSKSSLIRRARGGANSIAPGQSFLVEFDSDRIL
jgi:trimethyllysine dioxygenase